MKDSTSEQLDQLLRRWAERRSADDARLDAIHDRILAALDEPSPRAVGATGLHLDGRTGRLRFSRAVAAAALLVLVAAGLWSVVRPTADRPPEVADFDENAGADRETAAPSFARLEQDELAEKRALLQETGRLFGPQLTWIAETADRVRLGLDPDVSREPDDDCSVAVRLVVFRREAGGSAWTPVRSIDVISRSEQTVRLGSGSDGRALEDDVQLSLWAYALPDGMIFVETDLVVEAPDPARITESTLGRGGVPGRLASIRRGDVEYQVFQTAAVLDGNMG